MSNSNSDSKVITREEFKNATVQAMMEITEEPEVNNKALFLIPIIGAIFASHMEIILFGEDEKEKENKEDGSTK